MFYGIAIGGNKGAGKDFFADYIMRTRKDTKLIRCKTPIVERYEQIVGHPYDKARDDAELIHVSATMIRGGPNGNDNICKDYLVDVVPDAVSEGYLPIIPDMRRVPENEATHDILSLMCIKIEASLETRRTRTIRREGHFNNWKPDDDTEREVDSLKYHYVIDNDRDDGGKWGILQLERYLERAGARFARRPITEIEQGTYVRIIDQNSPFFWEIVITQENMTTTADTFALVRVNHTTDGKDRHVYASDLLVLDREEALREVNLATRMAL